MHQPPNRKEGGSTRERQKSHKGLLQMVSRGSIESGLGGGGAGP
jgi:hypothetical protein